MRLIHLNDISEETKEIFSNVRKTRNKMLEDFYRAFKKGIEEILPRNRNKAIEGRTHDIAFEKVKNAAKLIMVDKVDGGGIDKGWSISTFNSYVSKVKRALKFKIPLHIAEKANTRELQEVRKNIIEDDGNPDDEYAMESYYNMLKKKEKDKREIFRREYNDKKDKGIAETSFTLPAPDNYSSEDAEELRQDGIDGILLWLKSINSHLEGDEDSAKALSQVFEILEEYKNPKKKKVRIKV